MTKDLTTTVYTFEKIIESGYLYVDKTEYLWNLIPKNGGMYFLSRPRRFGKSLTVSTLKAIFQGKKELFKGLAIYDKPYDWKEYPIIHLDMGDCGAHTPDDLREYLARLLSSLAKEHGAKINIDKNQLALSFSDLIRFVSKEAPAVVLIDEYDKPLLENLATPNAAAFRDILADLYSTLKKESANERFVFITGVSKFCHVSLFSKLNNLQDITMSADYATMLGYTQAEFEANFADRIAETEVKQDLPHDKYLAKIKRWYDGFRFHHQADSVYNPVSLANFFISNGEFNNYWFSTGTPSFLFRLMKMQKFNLSQAFEEPVPQSFFEAFEIDQLNAQTLMYQTGYLTIDKTIQIPIPYTDDVQTGYMLNFPNVEVKTSFNDHLFRYYTQTQAGQSEKLIRELIRAVGEGNVDGFVTLLRVMFANIPYELHGKQEHDYQTIVYVIYMMLNYYIEAEHHTNDGRVDMMFCAGDYIYVVEFKLNKTARAAMKQIENKEYALKYADRGKKVIAIGINFDSQKGQIKNYLKEEIKMI